MNGGWLTLLKCAILDMQLQVLADCTQSDTAQHIRQSLSLPGPFAELIRNKKFAG
jgi:hypothetical protein